ncbi:rubrerythrin [Rhizobium binae]|uniref:Rubrerythrin n=1 Tax=Rhizobium binae TaxID=1138190 RepID=A0ABV2MDY4_9HYPH|nr:hypothetical protein [Rhizobium binae]MBX4992867.1 hypothetical protein [Rhizobium binae]NKL49413.1 hypothetical protein [Rhizobium leguminosarum bv. viciae]QSY84190.1 hypothetical protein J2J99_10575 [Rhizobium binae]
MTNTLSFELNKTAEWRTRKLERHPEDSRNQTARILLAQLSEQDANVELARRYDAIQDDEEISAERLGEVHSEILAEIGFSWEPKHVDEVLERIINRATGKAPTLTDVMEVQRKRGEADAAAAVDGKTAN